MSHISPGSYLVWALLTFFLCSFFIFHLWNFDKFQSFRWNNGSGTFKRVMVYTYGLTILIIFSYSFGFVAIKYREGFLAVPEIGTIPTPYFLWTSSHRSAIFPLMLIFSIGWSLEMVTHLEELCFWLFLINATAVERNWFQSPYFKTWVIGSTVAVLYMPLIAIFTRANPLKNEAYIFLGGSLGSISLTIWFIPVLWTFPSFLENLKSEEVDTATLVRLTKFSELNNIRVVFRFLFTIPLVILAVDGVRPHIHINENLFATDFLVIISAIGTVVSSAITLIIFFPRSIEREMATREAAKERKMLQKSYGGAESQMHMKIQHAHFPKGSNTLTLESVKALSSEGHEAERYYPYNQDWTEQGAEHFDAVPPLRPNRRKDSDVELGNQRLSVDKQSIRVANVNPMVSDYTSPIDIASYSNTNSGRLTFAR